MLREKSLRGSRSFSQYNPRRDSGYCPSPSPRGKSSAPPPRLSPRQQNAANYTISSAAPSNRQGGDAWTIFSLLPRRVLLRGNAIRQPVTHSMGFVIDSTNFCSAFDTSSSCRILYHKTAGWCRQSQPSTALQPTLNPSSRLINASTKFF